MTTPKRIEEIDENFKARQGIEGDCEWIGAFDERIAIRGLGWLCENREARNFRRIPLRAEGGMNDGVKGLLHHPASVFLSFRSNSKKISARMANADVSIMNHMPLAGSAGGELYLKQGAAWVPVATAIAPKDDPAFTRELLTDLTGQTYEYRFYLPLYAQHVSVAIGVDVGATVEPVPAPASQKPIVIYGTSITQGGCASTAGSDFVSVVGRELDAEIINLGFSGSGRGEATVAELMREIDAEMFIIDYAANTTAAAAKETLPVFVQILRDRHPLTPIVIMSQVQYNQHFWSHSRRLIDEERRDVFMGHYIDRRKAGDRNIYFIDGYGLLGPGESGDYVDGVHPTSAGFVQMAKRLLPQLRVIRKTNEDRLAGAPC